MLKRLHDHNHKLIENVLLVQKGRGIDTVDA